MGAVVDLILMRLGGGVGQAHMVADAEDGSSIVFEPHGDIGDVEMLRVPLAWTGEDGSVRIFLACPVAEMEHGAEHRRVRGDRA